MAPIFQARDEDAAAAAKKTLTMWQVMAIVAIFGLTILLLFVLIKGCAGRSQKKRLNEALSELAKTKTQLAAVTSERDAYAHKWHILTLENDKNSGRQIGVSTVGYLRSPVTRGEARGRDASKPLAAGKEAFVSVDLGQAK